ncbi:golgin subfamily A member 6-like protein 2 [Drosophila bipectinata]|uniref:golgin subfamily A member 6-like protein 2 n=1 Tax=Drosophila bipectinata TaxID=42026 RepID=UPI0038B40531
MERKKDEDGVGDPTGSRRTESHTGRSRHCGGAAPERGAGAQEEIGEVPPAEGGDSPHLGHGEEEGQKSPGDVRGDRPGVERRQERWTGESNEEGDVKEDAAATGEATGGGREKEESHEEDPASDVVARGATNTTPSIGTTGGKGGGNGRQKEAAGVNVACGTTYATPKEGGQGGGAVDEGAVGVANTTEAGAGPAALVPGAAANEAGADEVSVGWRRQGGPRSRLTAGALCEGGGGCGEEARTHRKVVEPQVGAVCFRVRGGANGVKILRKV